MLIYERFDDTMERDDVVDSMIVYLQRKYNAIMTFSIIPCKPKAQMSAPPLVRLTFIITSTRTHLASRLQHLSSFSLLSWQYLQKPH